MIIGALFGIAQTGNNPDVCPSAGGQSVVCWNTTQQ